MALKYMYKLRMLFDTCKTVAFLLRKQICFIQIFLNNLKPFQPFYKTTNVFPIFIIQSFTFLPIFFPNSFLLKLLCRCSHVQSCKVAFFGILINNISSRRWRITQSALTLIITDVNN